MEVVGEDADTTALALHAGLHGDHLPCRATGRMCCFCQMPR